MTNNASRGARRGRRASASRWASPPNADDVVTSAQSAARLLADPNGRPASTVLVIGTEALADEVRNVGLEPVRQFADEPDAVVQGHSPETGWADLAEAALAIRDGALWVAANVDRTLPSERGLLPGNGSMVAALRDRHRSASRRWRASHSRRCCTTRWPAASSNARWWSGDRLDTDIAGANAAGLPSLMVLTGVSTVADMVYADRRASGRTTSPPDLRSLNADSADACASRPHPAWRVEIGPQRRHGALRPAATPRTR